MKPLACRVKMFIDDELTYASGQKVQRWSNSPTLAILVDEMPETKDFRYEQKGSLYYGEKDGYVNFFAYDRPDQGYGGRHFPITMTDGTEKVLIGPWSSRAGVMNAAGFGPCLDVSITSRQDDWVRGYTFFAAAVTLDVALEAIKLWNEPRLGRDWAISLAEVKDGGDLRYDPVLTKGIKSQLFRTNQKLRIIEPTSDSQLSGEQNLVVNLVTGR